MSLAVHELRDTGDGGRRLPAHAPARTGRPISEKQKKMLEEADRSCSRLGALVAEMSEFGKLEGGEVAFARQDFDLSALIVELASGLHDAEDRGVQFEARDGKPAGMTEIKVTGDRMRIAAAVKALMQSALRERIEPGLMLARCSVRTGDGVTGNQGWGVVAIGDEAVLPDLEQGVVSPPAGLRRMARRPRTSRCLSPAASLKLTVARCGAERDRRRAPHRHFGSR
jgi:hypothetical protein